MGKKTDTLTSEAELSPTPEGQKCKFSTNAPLVRSNSQPLSSFKRIACFISDHGLGHASRCCAVIEELCRRGAYVIVVGMIPDWFIYESCPGATRTISSPQPLLEIYKFKTEVGTFQKTSVDIDPEKTIAELNAYWTKYYPTHKDDLVQKLKSERISTIYFDVCSCAPLIAEELNIPSIAVTNFAFDFIYQEWVDKGFKEFQKYVDICANAYRKATGILKLPYPCDFSNWEQCPVNVELGAWITRPVNHSRDEVLGIIDELLHEDEIGHVMEASMLEKKYMLLSFGGHDFPILERLETWQIPEDWCIVWVNQSNGGNGNNGGGGALRLSSGAIILSQNSIRARNINYVELVNAMDVVVMKTGYGIVSEVVVNNICTLYVDRPGFKEHIFLEQALKENVGCKLIDKEDVYDGNLFSHANQVLKNKKIRSGSQSPMQISYAYATANGTQNAKPVVAQGHLQVADFLLSDNLMLFCSIVSQNYTVKST